MVSPKDIVQEGMTLESRACKTVTEKSKSIERVFLTYRCPKPSCPVKTVTFKENSGFQIPSAHLPCCYGRGKSLVEQKSLLESMYRASFDTRENTGRYIRTHFEESSLSEYEQAVNHYARLIILRGYPLSCVNDPEVRAISKFSCVIDRKTIRSIIMSLFLLVEDRIKEAIHGKTGAVLFDGWTTDSTHYVRMLLSYTDNIMTIVDGTERLQNVNRLVLMAASPMASIVSEGEEDEELGEDDNGLDHSCEETISFKAQTHLAVFRDNFVFFREVFNDWCVGLIAENCRTNRKISTDAQKVMVGCYSHKLNLEANYMITKMSGLQNTLSSIHDTMKAAKSRLNNSAMLRNLTNLSAVIPNETRWSGKSEMMTRFVRIRSELLAVADDANCGLPIDRTNLFAEKAKRYSKMLKEINCVTKVLQTRSISLSECYIELKDVCNVIYLWSRRPEAPLHGCKLAQKYIGVDSHLVTHKFFEFGVIKLQENASEDLTDAEKFSFSCLKVNNVSDASSNISQSEDHILSMHERQTKRRKICALPRSNCPCDFILGSVSEVERVWSVANHFLGYSRHSIAPLLLESLLFLRYNDRFWDERLVAQAICHARSARAVKRIAHLQKEIENIELLHD